MSATLPITLEWLNDKGNKFAAYNISADALALINCSETIKSDIRDYAASDYVTDGRVNSTAGLGQYNPYVAGSGSTSEVVGYLDIAADRFSTPESTVQILAHELGHFRVEEPGAAIANARANAWTARDQGAYESACNLTEGYARLNEVRVGNELVAATRAQAAAEGRDLTVHERVFVDRWSGSGAFANSPEGSAHNIVQRIEQEAAADGKFHSLQEIANAAAMALGDDYKGYQTSSTGETYFDFCRRGAQAVISGGATPAPPSAYGQERFETTYNADGSVANSSVAVTLGDGDEHVTVFDASGRTLWTTEIDGAFDDADYAWRTTAYDAQGRVDFTQTHRDDGSRNDWDNDQDGTQGWKSSDVHFDAQGRRDWQRVIEDDDSVVWIDADQADERGNSVWSSHTDAQGRQDWQRVIQDDGSVDWIDFDQADERGSSIWSNHTDAQGRQDWQRVIQDDGSVDWIDFDQADERGNSIWSSHTDAQGREDWQRAVKDDGSVDWTDFDQAGEFDHRVWSNHSDTQGREDWRDVVLDDGGRDFTDFDQTNVRGDRVVTTRYDIRGLEDWRDATLDDGSRDWSDFDQTNVRADSVVASHFDAQGREDWRNAVMDDGRRDWTDFDQDGSQGWNRAESHYDAQGREDYSDFFMDDGRRNSFDHDQDGSHAWSRFDAGFDASGHLDASTRYFDDGSRLSIDYDHFGAGVNEMLGYNAQGQLNLIAREYHGIVLTSGGRWNPAYGDGLHVVTVINANTGALSTPIQSPAPISVPDPDPWPNAHAEVGPMTPA